MSWEITPAGTRAYWHSPEITGPDLFNPYMTGYQAGCLGTGPLLVRRAFLDQAGPFDEQFRCYADTDLIIRLQRLCRFHHIRKPLCTSRSRQDPATSPLEKSISLLLLLQKNPEALEEPVFLDIPAGSDPLLPPAGRGDILCSGPEALHRNRNGSATGNRFRISDTVLQFVCSSGPRHDRHSVRRVFTTRKWPDRP